MFNSIQNNVLPITIDNHTFNPNHDGIWSLNEIHQALHLPEAKRPSEWNNGVSAELLASGNFRKVDKVGSFADELGTIAYAMWVSTEFYLMVAHAFVKVRNDSILSARMALLASAEADAKLAKAIPKVDLVDRRLSRSGIPWSEACRLAGVNNPQLAKLYLVRTGRFIFCDHPTEYKKIIKPVKQGMDLGYFKWCSMSFGNQDGYRVTAKGLVWLQGKAQEINTAIADRARREVLGRRARHRN